MDMATRPLTFGLLIPATLWKEFCVMRTIRGLEDPETRRSCATDYSSSYENFLLTGRPDLTLPLSSALSPSASDPFAKVSTLSGAFSSIVDVFDRLGPLVGVGGRALGFTTVVPIKEDGEDSDVPYAFGVATKAGCFETVCVVLGDEPRRELFGEACTVEVSLVFDLGGELGTELIGPKITLEGTFFGAGLGMYGCFRPLGSYTVGIFLGAGDGLRIPFDSPKYFGLSSQLEEIVGIDVLDSGGLSNGLSSSIENEVLGLLSGFGATMIGGRDDTPVHAVCTGTCGFSSILGGGTLGSRSKPGCASLGAEDLTTGGPASRGVLNAFSQEPGLGSASARLGCTGGGMGPRWVFSILSSAT